MAMKNIAERGIIAVKSRVLGAKSGYLELKKIRVDDQIERQSGAKCRRNARKRTKEEPYKAGNCTKLPANCPLFSLERSVQMSVFCKI